MVGAQFCGQVPLEGPGRPFTKRRYDPLRLTRRRAAPPVARDPASDNAHDRKDDDPCLPSRLPHEGPDAPAPNPFRVCRRVAVNEGLLTVIPQPSDRVLDAPASTVAPSLGAYRSNSLRRLLTWCGLQLSSVASRFTCRPRQLCRGHPRHRPRVRGGGRQRQRCLPLGVPARFTAISRVYPLTYSRRTKPPGHSNAGPARGFGHGATTEVVLLKLSYWWAS
jgi:hypothetical protein